MKQLVCTLLVVSLLSSCASKKRLVELQTLQEAHKKALADLTNCDKRITDIRADVRLKEDDLAAQNKQLQDLQSQLDYLKKTNTNLLDRMSDLSIVSKAGAESIRKSLETLNEQNKYIQTLNNSVQKKDSVNLTLVMNLKRSLADVNDQDVQVEVKKGVVFVSISDKMLFKTASYELSPRAESVLAKVARIINDHKELDVLVEGHTDVIPIQTDFLQDNWDLSAMRATSVARELQTKFGVAPERLTAGGRSEYSPKSDNATAEGRAINRRTEIILTPKLDQFFNLLSPGK